MTLMYYSFLHLALRPVSDEMMRGVLPYSSIEGLMGRGKCQLREVSRHGPFSTSKNSIGFYYLYTNSNIYIYIYIIYTPNLG